MAKTEIILGEAGGKVTSITQDETPSTVQASKSYTLEVGKPYLFFVWDGTSGSFANTRFDGATATGATITKLGNMLTVASNAAGTFYQVIPTQTNVTISTTTGIYILFTPE